MTKMEGVFAAGDFRQGKTTFVVDAVGEGHKAADAIHRYLIGMDLHPSLGHQEQVVLSESEMLNRLDLRESARETRTGIPHLPPKQRKNCFDEVDLRFCEEEALREAGRCLTCGPCSECMACLDVCEPGAITHLQISSDSGMDFDWVVIADDEIPDPDCRGALKISANDPLSGSAAAFQVLSELGMVSFAQSYRSDSSMEQPDMRKDRVGLVLCHCGGEISNSVDFQSIAVTARKWPGIITVQDLPHCCSDQGAALIKGIIQKDDLNKLVLAACSCCSLDQICFSCTYQRMRCKEYLGLFSKPQFQADIECANIREQCAWAHGGERHTTTAAAEKIIQAALARMNGAGKKPHHPINRVSTSVLILGSGTAAEICSAGLNSLGIKNLHIPDLPRTLLRIGGYYLINNPSGEHRVELIIFAPRDQEELKQLLASHRIGNGKSVLTSTMDQQTLLDYGIVVCPPAADPLTAGQAAAARIGVWISRVSSSEGALSAEVDWSRCRACSTCLEVCGFGIPEIVEDGYGRHARIDPGLCLGCGTCAAHCPSGAISPGLAPDNTIELMLDTVLK
jgi:MinD superfamily P-loop ATPase